MSNPFNYYDNVNINSFKVRLGTYLIINVKYFILGELALTFNTNGKIQKY